MSTEKEYIEIYGAREHNLKNINVKIPRNELVTITGLSGSGKSSLAFDTIFAEGQRRYIETFSAYARQFLGGLERPDVDKIEGLSPVIAIEQKTTNKNPRSTVGTVTELYDFLRLLFARVSDAYSLETGQKMVSYTEEQILETIKENYKGEKVLLLAPVIRSRKGHYHELFVQLAKKGYSQARIDGELQDIEYDLKLDRYKTHDIEVVIDRWIIGENATESRMAKSLKTALQMGDGVVMIQKLGATDYQYFSKNLMDAHSGNALPIPEPNTFSFNSPKGSCPACKGLGTIKKINEEFLVENPNFSINFKSQTAFLKSCSVAFWTSFFGSKLSFKYYCVVVFFIFNHLTQIRNQPFKIDFYFLRNSGVFQISSKFFLATVVNIIYRFTRNFIERSI